MDDGHRARTTFLHVNSRSVDARSSSCFRAPAGDPKTPRLQATDKSGRLSCRHGRLQKRQPLGLGLQVPLGVDDEVPIPDSGWRSRPEVSRPTKENSAQQGGGDLCGACESRSRPSTNKYAAANIGVTCGAVSEGEEFAQTVVRVCKFAEALLVRFRCKTTIDTRIAS